MQAIRKAPGAGLPRSLARAKRVQAAREAYPQARVHRDWRALVADPSLEAVDIVVPNHLHARSRSRRSTRARTCCSKPMASTIAECEQILAAVRRTGRVLSVGHEFRISTQWGFIKRLIAAGEIGELLYANVSLFRFPTAKGSATGATAGIPSALDLEEPVHFFDMLMWWFARSRRPGERAGLGNSKGRGAGMYDNFSAVMRWPDGPYARDARPSPASSTTTSSKWWAGRARYGPGGPGTMDRSRRSTS